MNILVVTKEPPTGEIKTLFKEFNKESFRFAWKNTLTKKLFENISLVISIGGDGTFLSASHFIDKQPILGVNSNHEKSEGALLNTKLKDLQNKLKLILAGKSRIKNYTRENIKIFKENSCILTEDALNEAYIGNKNPQHSSNYTIELSNKKEKQKSSGILISTGTGSTAWYNSMGGWSFSREKLQLRFRVREPFQGKLHKVRLTKGKINANEKISIISNMNHGLLAIDSIRTYELKENDKVEISLGNPLRVIQ